jgi:4-diphosphocytidyl-2-C-methyl-D-erythritol kinase
VQKAELAPRAKVNLLFRVLGREASGYHSIETLFLRLDLADRIVLAVGVDEGVRLRVNGDPTVPADESNLCWQAAELVSRAVGVSPAVRIELEKRIPSGAGLGGGSADAAAVLLGLNGLLGEPLGFRDLLHLASQLGSDVPFALADVDLALAWERGRRLVPLVAPPSRPALILAPEFPISAGEAYAWLADDRKGSPAPSGGPSSLFPPPGELTSWEGLCRVAHNDLEAPVFRRHPDLERAKEALRLSGAGPALLCGSGSCLLGVYGSESERDRAAVSLAEATGFRSVMTRTAGSG